MTGSIGAAQMVSGLVGEALDDTSLLNRIWSTMDEASARRVFAHASATKWANLLPEEAFSRLEQADAQFKRLGFSTLLTPDVIARHLMDLGVVKILSEKNLVNFEEMKSFPWVHPGLFAIRSQGKYEGLITNRDEANGFVDLCIKSRAYDHIERVAEEVLDKGINDVRFSSPNVQGYFFQAILEKESIAPDDLLRSPKRIQRLIDMGVSSEALGKSKRFKGRLRDQSFSADLGL